MDIGGFIKDIGRSFLISSLLPAVFFTAVVASLFRSIFRFPDASSLFVTPNWFFAAVVVWIAFGLYSILPWTLRFFGGEFFPLWLKKWMISRFRKYNKTSRAELDKIIELRNEILQRQEQKLNPTAEQLEQYEELLPKARAQFIDLSLVGPVEKGTPLDEKLYSPTRFGNLMIAAMLYPQKYNINGDVIWPRLLKVLPKQFVDDKDDTEARLIFLLNSSLLCYLIGFICLAMTLLGLIWAVSLPTLKTITDWLWNYILSRFFLYPNLPFYTKYQPLFSQLLSPTYLILATVFIGLGYLIYRTSVFTAESFVIFVRSSFDLYRFELLKQLNISLPTDSIDELGKWELISELWTSGYDLSLDPAILTYSKPNHENSKSAGTSSVSLIYGRRSRVKRRKRGRDHQQQRSPGN